MVTKDIDLTPESVERLAGVMPRYFGVWSRTGVHVGVWEDGHIAFRVLADEYPGGKVVEMVDVRDGGKYAAALSARLADLESLARGQDEQLEIQGNALIAMNRRATEQSARAKALEAQLAQAVEALHPFAARMDEMDKVPNASKYASACDIDFVYLRNARATLAAIKAKGEGRG